VGPLCPLHRIRDRLCRRPRPGVRPGQGRSQHLPREKPGIKGLDMGCRKEELPGIRDGPEQLPRGKPGIKGLDRGRRRSFQV
jgi:hypothetical protein